MLLDDFRPQPLQAFDMQINGTRTNRAATGQRNPRPAAARHQRPQNQSRSAHGFHQLVGSFRRIKLAAKDSRPVLRAAIAELDLSAHGGQQLARGLNIAYVRNIFQNDRLVSQQSGRHRRQRGVLCPAHSNRAQQRIAATNYKLVHRRNPK